MKVLFDIGNSRIKWALAEADSLGAVSSISHGADCVAELLAALPGSVDAAWAVNVAGAALESRLSEGLQQQFGIQLQL